LNISKEKKLNAIKSEILEITNFVTSNKEEKNEDIHLHEEIKIDSNDTLTLTNIVNSEHKAETKDDFAKIKNELFILKSILTKQDKVLKEILLKIK
jgi:predicted translin family RNA/ssDNA-binding protein